MSEWGDRQTDEDRPREGKGKRSFQVDRTRQDRIRQDKDPKPLGSDYLLSIIHSIIVEMDSLQRTRYKYWFV